MAMLLLVFITNISFRYAAHSNSGYYVVIEKSKYELNVFDNEGWLATYPVVFGNNNLGDKLMEGDRKTPEGNFKLVSKRIHEKWDRFMMLDYPTPESYAKFNQRKASGMIPPFAKIGGGVGIHGTWPHEGYTIDRYENWTQGCISMHNEDVEELYAMLTIGSPIIIRK